MGVYLWISGSWWILITISESVECHLSIGVGVRLVNLENVFVSLTLLLQNIRAYYFSLCSETFSVISDKNKMYDDYALAMEIST